MNAEHLGERIEENGQTEWLKKYIGLQDNKILVTTMQYMFEVRTHRTKRRPWAG